MHITSSYRNWIFVLMFHALAGCASYEECGLGGCAGDKELTAAVESAFKDHADLQPPNMIKIQTINHTVYLYGIVSTDLQRQMAESVAQGVPGVTKVVNSISVDNISE